MVSDLAGTLRSLGKESSGAKGRQERILNRTWRKRNRANTVFLDTRMKNETDNESALIRPVFLKDQQMIHAHASWLPIDSGSPMGAGHEE